MPRVVKKIPLDSEVPLGLSHEMAEQREEMPLVESGNLPTLLDRCCENAGTGAARPENEDWSRLSLGLHLDILCEGISC